MFRTNLQDRSAAVAVPIVYGVLEATLICLYCIVAWKAGWTKAPADEALWTVISKSYEGIEPHHLDEHGHPHADEDEGDHHMLKLNTCSSRSMTTTTDSTVHSYAPVSVEVSLEEYVGELRHKKTNSVGGGTTTTTTTILVSGGGIQDCSTHLAKRFVLEREETVETVEESFV